MYIIVISPLDGTRPYNLRDENNKVVAFKASYDAAAHAASVLSTQPVTWDVTYKGEKPLRTGRAAR